MSIVLRALGAALVVLLGVAVIASFERPPVDAVQRGYRGLAMGEVYNPRILATQASLNAVPEDQGPSEKADQPASAVYENVQVLKDVDANEFLRLMASITQWVAPEQGCTYCHKEGASLADDSLYTKVVARRMLQMTRTINDHWKNHVGATGVTCYTCHRGQPVPQNVWFEQAPRDQFGGPLGVQSGKPAAIQPVAFSSLPNDVFTPFLEYAQEIRVAGPVPLAGNRHSIKQAEATYGLMMHFSQSLGVNCTFCHNSRAFREWDQSTPQRATAWYGIRMVREVNDVFLASLKSTFPHARLGEVGDVAKVNCLTCHQGAYKPLYGASMLKGYPELASSKPEDRTAIPPKTP